MQQLRHTSFGRGMSQITIGLTNRQRFAARTWQRCVVEHLLPVLRPIRAAAVQLVLHQFPGICIVLIVGHRIVESSLENRFQLAVLHIASDANADFAQEHNDQKDGELQHKQI